MLILLAGAWAHPMYETACADALTAQGVSVVQFAWTRYFRGLLGRAQNKYPMVGPAMIRLNRDLMIVSEELRPDCIWVWRGTHILAGTLREMHRRTGALLVSYCNDDPFQGKGDGRATWHPRYYWHRYLRSIPEYDLNFVYRPVNVPEIREAGAKSVHILMPYFIPSVHRPTQLSEEEEDQFGCDVVFVGHYEPDGREEYLRSLVRAGLHVRLFGGGTWTKMVLGDLSHSFGDIRPVHGEEYAKALTGAKMCLCFLSRMNRDTYTRRCFEIPACGKLLLSERTIDLCKMFREDQEAVFFSSPQELTEKAIWLREHPDEVDRIAQAGMLRVHADGHSVDERMKQVLTRILDGLQEKRSGDTCFTGVRR
jgi:spore maturation protein CgeB